MSEIRVYQIAKWNEYFENSRSREIEVCSWVAIPNKHHGTGFQRIMGSADGMAMYGLWCLIVQACSRQRAAGSFRRDGWLTDDGTAVGYPWDAADLAARWQQPVELVQRGLDLLCSVRIGWMVLHEQLPDGSSPDGSVSAVGGADMPTAQLPAEKDKGARTPRRGARREEKRMEVDGTTPASSPAIFRIQGVDDEGICRSLVNADLLGLIAAFHGNISIERHDEWLREADQLTLHEIMVIFAWRRRERDNIREPSGLRQARDQWRSLPIKDRREMAVDLLRSYGVDPPAALIAKCEGDRVA